MLISISVVIKSVGNGVVKYVSSVMSVIIYVNISGLISKSTLTFDNLEKLAVLG